MLLEQNLPHEIAISGGADETADFAKASDVLECDDVGNDMRVLTNNPKRRYNFTENGFNSTPKAKQIKFLNGKVRRKGDGSIDHPTPVDFRQRTLMLLAEGVMCGNANCEPDVILETTQIIPQTDEDHLELVIDESATIIDCPEAQE
ncbi:hypothetical protein AVEN_19979-1 [Araneus ventricosus]|uniref:Uncharacterized protein n=1 Tax=Araneus ventricosus TaxID=182803 RepID=A0A4Y2R9W9_ARAVE|nr:hypothetical protein AVEN_19979-1 [Araneus ventricosus]